MTFAATGRSTDHVERTRADDKRADIVRCAIKIFGDRGYRATSMNEVANASGLRKPTLYHYFGSKQDLLVSIFEEVAQASVQATQEIVEAELSGAETLERMLIDRVTYSCRNQHLLRIFHEEESELPPRLLTRVHESRRDYQSVMTKVLEHGLATNTFVFDATPKLVANALIGACNWSYKWYRPHGNKTPEELGSEIASVLMLGIVRPSAR